MAVDEGIIKLIIESLDDRCLSLKNELDKLQERKYPSSGPYKLIEFIKKANNKIHNHIHEVSNRENLKNLSDKQVEIYLYRYSKLIPYLHILLTFLKGAETGQTPAPLIQPLKRLINRYLPDSEVIFLSDPELNYSFLELSEVIAGVFETHFEDLVSDFPSYFMIISFPEVEMKNTLLHCILAHEIGHGFYSKENLSDKLMEIIYKNIKKRDIEKVSQLFYRMISKKKEGKSEQPSLFPTELQVKEMITSRVNEIIQNWVEELASDSIAICILGPAYYFAFIHFITSCSYINDSSYSHPSPKMRILFMSWLMRNKKLNYIEIFDGKMSDFYSKWLKIAQSPSVEDDPMILLIMKSLENKSDEMGEQIIKSMKDKVLSLDELKDLQELKKLILHIIPPNEIVGFKDRRVRPANIYSILNAGWLTYISEFDVFFENIKNSLKNQNKYEAKKKLNEILSKALELDEIQKTAKE